MPPSCCRLSWLMSAFERTLKQHLVSYRTTRCRILRLKCTIFDFRPRWWSLQCSSESPSCIRGPTSKGGNEGWGRGKESGRDLLDKYQTASYSHVMSTFVLFTRWRASTSCHCQWTYTAVRCQSGRRISHETYSSLVCACWRRTRWDITTSCQWTSLATLWQCSPTSRRSTKTNGGLSSLLSLA